MFDLAWSEIALIAVVALVVIGPKDLPTAIRGVADGIKKMRKMAGEFQQQADELVKEAKLDELRNQIQDVRSTISDIKNFDLRDQFDKHVDKDGTLRGAMTDTMGEPWTPPAATAPGTEYVAPAEAPAFVPPSVAATTLPPPPPKPSAPAPAFVPPSYAPPEPVNYAPISAPPPVVATAAPAPSMIPPASAPAEPARAASAV